MATQKDWNGFYTILKEMNVKEDEFAIIIVAFIELKYPDFDPIPFFQTDKGLEIMDSLFKLF